MATGGCSNSGQHLHHPYTTSSGPPSSVTKALTSTSSTSSMLSTSTMDGRQRRRLGKQKMAAQICALKTQIGVMKQIIEDQQKELDSLED
eukprot:11798096-Karenia_brevis.AAC.1